MSVFDKMKDKAEQLMGGAKEKFGEVTGNQDVADSGRADQVTGEAKEMGHDLRDKAANAVQDMKDKFTR